MKKTTRQALQPKSNRLALEPRIVFDAALPIVGLDHFDLLHESLNNAHRGSAPEVDAPGPGWDAPFEGLAASPEGEISIKEIVFVDARVADVLPFIKSTDSILVVRLEANQDGVLTIQQTLQSHQGVNAIHVISHGASGELRLGNTLLTQQSMQEKYSAELKSIGQALGAEADLLIYGCNFGEGAAGSLATQTLAQLTGADVASSTTVTGSASEGGDWVLERRTGSIETDLALDADAQRSYQGTFVDLVPVGALTITAGPGAINVGGVLTPKTSPVGDVVGSKAVYTNVANGTFDKVGGGTYTGIIDLVGTITSVAAFDTNDTITFSITNGNPAVLINGQANGGVATVHWELFETGTTNLVKTSFAFIVGDIDGVSTTSPRESVSASTGNGLTSYAFENDPLNPSHLIVTNDGNKVTAIGTQNELPVVPLSNSTIQFSWNNVSNVDFTYGIAVNSVTTQALFTMNGVSSVSPYTLAATTTLGLDLDGNNSSTATGNNFANTFYVGSTSVPVIDIDPSFTLPPANFSSGTVRLTNAQAGDQLVVGTLPSGITATVSTVGSVITVSLSGTATPANYAAAIRAITFNNPLGAPDTGTVRSVEVQLSDGAALTNAPVASIRVSPNLPPVNTLPAYTSPEDSGTVALTGISIADGNAGAAEVFTINFGVPNASGTISATAGGGVTVTGTNSNSLTLTGTRANLNTFLGGGSRPVYTPVPDFNGSVTLTVVTRDGIAAPNQGVDTDFTTITRTPVVDTVVDNLTTLEETLVEVNVLTNDLFANATRAVVSVTQGANGVVEFVSGGTVTYTPNANFVGTDSFQYTVFSGGTTETGTVNVTVNPVNDAPVNTMPVSFTASVGSPMVVSGLSVSDVDIAGAAFRVTLTVSSGTLSASTGGGVAVTGSGTASMVLDGTIAAINAFLAASAPTYSASGAGTFTLTMVSSDLGGTGVGGVLTDSDVRNITALAATNPIVDLNSGPSVVVGAPTTSTSNLVLGGDFGTTVSNTPASPWVEVAPVAAAAIDGSVVDGTAGAGVDGRWVWANNSADNATLTQALVVPAPSNVITTATPTSTVETATVDAITSIAFGFAWANNDITFAFDNTLNVSYNGVLYATFTTFGAGVADGSGIVGNWAYFNGASGPSSTNSISDESQGALTTITIVMPAGITQSGNLVFNYNNGPSGSGADDIAIDNVVVTSTKTTIVTTTSAATVDYNWAATFTENGASVAIADTDSSIFDSSDTHIDSASIVLSNPFAGDQLIVVGSLPSGMVATGSGTSTVTLSGSFTKAQYVDAIEKIHFNNTSEAPNATVRVINVTVSDGVLNSNTAVATITVVPINDAPAGTDKTVSTLEDTAYTFSAADFGFSDISDSPANALANVKISTLSTTGTLKLSGVAVAANQLITLADIPNLTWTPASNANGNAISTFTFQVIDDGGTANGGVNTDASPNTITFNVTPVNDAPAGADKTVSTLEDTAYTFSAADFGFSDISDSPANALANVKISTLSTTGTLKLSGVAVTANQLITLANIPNLTWTPASNATGNAISTFTFQVIDDGGTADGGVNTDASPNTITFNVTPVNDPPVGVLDTASVTESGTGAGNVAIPGTPSASGNVLANDTDPDALDTKTVSLVNGAAGNVGTAIATTYGTITLNADGSYTYTLDNARAATQALTQGQVVTETFTDQVRDTAGLTSDTSLTVTVNGTNDTPLAAPISLAGTAGDAIPVRLTATDPDGIIVSFTITTLPSANQGMLILADGTQVVQGQVLTPAQAASLSLKTNPGFVGAATFTFKATDNQGGESLASTATINVTPGLPTAASAPNINPTTIFLSPTGRIQDFGNLRVNFGTLPLRTNDAVYVSLAVRDSQNVESQAGKFDVFITDAGTTSELNNFTFDLNGAAQNETLSLFVQNAIRGLPIGTEISQFVHNSVMQSQMEAAARHLGITGKTSEHNPKVRLFSDFDSASFAIENVASDHPSDKSSFNTFAQDARQPIGVNPVDVMENNADKPAIAPLDIPQFEKVSKMNYNELSKKQQAASSFGNQLAAASRKLKSSGYF